ncbi:hypothetical protein Tco_0237615 [Tanacetum coccineum]
MGTSNESRGLYLFDVEQCALLYLSAYGKEPSLSHIKCFGCLCDSTVLNNHDKFSSSTDGNAFKSPNDDERDPSNGEVNGSRDWNSPEFQDTANSGQKKAMVFYQMDTEEVSDRFVDPCFVNELEAYDGEINLGVEENMISNEYAFIINPEEDDVEPGVIFGRSFLRLTKAITDFGTGTVTIYLDIDLFLEEKSNDDWDHLLDFNIDDIPMLGEEGLPPFGKERERANNRGTMAYHDKYKKILDEVWKDKVELDGKIVKEEEEAIKRIKGEALKEKDDPGAFIFPIRLEGQLEEKIWKKVD